MIVRVLGEGQFDVPDDGLDELNELDGQLVAAIDARDNEKFARALQSLLDGVRSIGAPVPDDFLGPSDYVLPSSDATLEEVRDLLSEEGLLPG